MMRQLFFLRKGKLERRDVKAPVINAATEALVRPLSAARCDLDDVFLFQEISLKLKIGNLLRLTDKNIRTTFGKNFFKGPFPFGHECIAEITDLGDQVKNYKIGDLVIVPFQISCGDCFYCLRGITSACAETPLLSMYGFGKHLQFGGAVSDLLKVPFADAMLIRIPRHMDYIHLASMADNVPDAYGRVAPYLAADPKKSVLVLGGKAKSIGLYCVMIAKALGCPQVHYADNDTERLAIAKNAGADQLIGSFRDIHQKYGLVVDASASENGLQHALNSLQKGGICSSTGIHFKKAHLPLVSLYVNGGMLVTGLANARPDAARCLELVQQGMNLGLITTKVENWENAQEAFLQPGIKVIVHRERVT
jgi:threonine dehydrogenase-like Zn-dependent dehydrogenase